MYPNRTRRDRFSKAKRSEIMSRIHSKNTKLDNTMKEMLRRAGVGFRMYPKLMGNPDFLIGNRLTLFCDSSFWHGRDWRRLKRRLVSGSNPSYWVNHISRNRRRDRIVSASLRKLGFAVVRFWDSDVYHQPDECIDRIRKEMKSRRTH